MRRGALVPSFAVTVTAGMATEGLEDHPDARHRGILGTVNEDAADDEEDRR